MITFTVDDGPVPATKALDIVATYRVHGEPFRRSLQARRPRFGDTMSERTAHEGGFTLIELLVSMLVMLLVLMVTNGLLVESLRIFSNSGRELREPGTELALRLLREDLHASAPIAAGVSTHLGLPCRRPERKDVWEMDGNRLVRRTYDSRREPRSEPAPCSTA